MNALVPAVALGVSQLICIVTGIVLMFHGYWIAGAVAILAPELAIGIVAVATMIVLEWTWKK